MNDHDKLGLVRKVSKSYRGDSHHLERALGMLMMGDDFGWKVLFLMHDKKTLKKYETILGINVKETFPERGPLARKSIGLSLLDTVTDFWKAVKGETPLPDRRILK